ncbi:thiamine phosphate synthase [Virgibacillus halotolerans]|uniref:thiamine phosphate synthase n=1 Tax=Virgibacillus halotolerans TaxID=1071053 RepID=UPI0019621B54|nr:thiamine phosphate synthase [Virgibacillus halotolerans]
MGSQNCETDPVEILEDAIVGGITAFQFREKGVNSLTGKAKLTLGKRLREVCRDHRIPFFINDDIDLVEPLHVDGIHVGQDDVSVKELRRLYPNLLIGLSISNEQELFNSPLSIVDYIGAGPIFDTNSKDDAKKAVGVQWIETVRRAYPELPIVGIGGINTENAALVIEAGADGVSVISAITKAENIAEAVKAL